MLRNWKLLTLLAATIISVEPAFVHAQAENADVKALLDRIEKMDTSLQGSFKAMADDISQLKKDMATMRGETLNQRIDIDKANTRLDTLEIQLKTLRTELDVIKAGLPTKSPAVDKASLDDIRATLAQIELALAKLQTVNRVSLSPPSMGRVVLVNLYNEDLLFVINNQTHRVPPNATMPLESIPAGRMSYEVISGTWGSRANSTINLAPNETFTLTAR